MVNAVATNPVCGRTFATGGGDNKCNLWDYEAKQRLKVWWACSCGVLTADD